jgi:PAS domain-containing protein
MQERIRKEGMPIWFHLNGKVLDPMDPGKGALWVLTDVTAQHEAQEALRASEVKYATLFRILPSGVALVDATGHIQECPRRKEDPGNRNRGMP